MSRYTATPDSIVLTHTGTNDTSSYSLVNASSIAQALGTKGDSRYVRLTIPYNSSGASGCNLEFYCSTLPPIDATKKQSRWLRCVVGLRTVNSTSTNLKLQFRGVAGTTPIAAFPSITINAAISAPGNIYTFVFPINGSNGGTNYWLGADSNLVRFQIVGANTSSVSNDPGYIDIDYVRFEYGEADDYIDVDITAAVNRDAGLGGTAWVNPALALPPDTDGATYANSSTNSYALDCTFPNFVIPGKLQGLEVWNGMVPQRFSRLVIDLANWPLSVPVSNTPIYESVMDFNFNPLPPQSVTPPGGSGGNAAIMGYWVWGGGPGDLFVGDEFGTAYNGWTGITEARLTGGGHASSHVIGMRSSVVTPSSLNRVFYRVFYDRVAGATPLQLCEA